MHKSLDESTKKKILAEDSKKEHRTLTMVILNSIVNFILRFPEIIVVFGNSQSFFSIILSIFSSAYFIF
jgi:hypothetical protein